MRVVYQPESQRAWEVYYLNQATQSGAGFIGMPYQRGAGLGSFFRGLFRALLPVAKSAGKALGKQALSTGAQIASDVVAGRTIKEATKRRGKAGAATLLRKAATKISQSGRGLGRKPKRKRTTNVLRKTARKRQTKKKYQDQLGLYYK